MNSYSHFCPFEELLKRLANRFGLPDPQAQKTSFREVNTTDFSGQNEGRISGRKRAPRLMNLSLALIPEPETVEST